METTRDDLRRLRLRSIRFAATFGAGVSRVGQLAGSVAGMPLFALALGFFVRIQSLWRTPRS